jgi:hypothetical protein
VELKKLGEVLEKMPAPIVLVEEVTNKQRMVQVREDRTNI